MTNVDPDGDDMPPHIHAVVERAKAQLLDVWREHHQQAPRFVVLLEHPDSGDLQLERYDCDGFLRRIDVVRGLPDENSADVARRMEDALRLSMPTHVTMVVITTKGIGTFNLRPASVV